MKQVALLAVLLCSALSAVADDAPPADINAYLEPNDAAHSSVSDTVYRLLTDAGKTIGFQGGKAQRAWEIKQALKGRDNSLSAAYDFRPLICSQGYLPPVIDTAQNMADITQDQIRTAYRTYKILVPARFVSNPPTWRTYLLVGLSSDRIPAPDNSVRPKNSDEQDVWEAAIQKGWSEGREAADHTLESNFNRLTRDYVGMLQYSTLLQQGLIEAPDITEHQQSVTGSREQLLIGDKVRTIKDPAGFIVNKGQWQPVIAKGRN
ncbi:type IV secretory system conjugative DNA transfer family protein [Salmonella enterica subsp. enterica]